MHPLHYWPGTQKFLNPRTAGAPDSGVLIGWPSGFRIILRKISAEYSAKTV
eukprot:COSAG01_NODE_46792_length_396_cov_181.040404_1_plen_50_part_10